MQYVRAAEYERANEIPSSPVTMCTTLWKPLTSSTPNTASVSPGDPNAEEEKKPMTPARTSVQPITRAQTCAGDVVMAYKEGGRGDPTSPGPRRAGSEGRECIPARGGIAPDDHVSPKDIHLLADEELMQLVTRGDPRAFERIHHPHGAA